ncbi:Ig-like domain-containing protein, partial [Escherichia coli]|nr:Ig-like domain-containing protein [Escherichia coli]
TTNSNGLAFINLVSITPVTYPVSATVGKKTGKTEVIFVKQNVKHVNMWLVRNNEKANGNASNIIKARLSDDNNQPVKNVELIWNVPDFVNVKNEKSVTDENGEIQSYFTSTVVGDVSVSGTAGNIISEIKMNFTPDSGMGVNIENIMKIMVNDGAIADGQSKNIVTVYLNDKNGMPVQNADIYLSTTGSAELSAEKIKTDAQGMVIISIVNKIAETVNITARANLASNVTAYSTFMKFGVYSLVNSKSIAIANGKDKAYLRAIVKDVNGNLIKNTPVAFSVSGHAVLSAASVSTGENGEATIAVSNKYNEVVSVNARAEKFKLDHGADSELKFISSKITGVTSDSSKGIFSVGSG